MVALLILLHLLFITCSSIDCKRDSCSTRGTSRIFKRKLANKRYPFHGNGCGKQDASFWQTLGQKLVFFPLGGTTNYNYICDWHDMCYSICGISQHFCDDIWGDMMYLQCMCVEHGYKINCDIWRYASGNIMKGTSCKTGEAYYDGQVSECTCVNSDINKRGVKEDLIARLKPFTDKLKARGIRISLPSMRGNVVNNIEKWLMNLMWNPAARKALISSYGTHEPNSNTIAQKSEDAVTKWSRHMCKLSSGNKLARYMDVRRSSRTQSTTKKKRGWWPWSAYRMDGDMYDEDMLNQRSVVTDVDVAYIGTIMVVAILMLLCVVSLVIGIGCGYVFAKNEIICWDYKCLIL